MIDQQKSSELLRIAAAAKELADEGYNVVIEPGVEDLPFEIGNYQPDLIAFKDNEGIVLEVNVSQTGLSIDRFQEIAEKIASLKGWRFLLVTLDDLSDKILPEESSDLPSWEELGLRIDKANTLLGNRLFEPGLLFLWSIIKATLRKRAMTQKLPIERFPPHKLMNHMFSSGELSMEQFDLLNALFKKRNRAAHGLVVALDLGELQKAADVSRSMINGWSEKTS